MHVVLKIYNYHKRYMYNLSDFGSSSIKNCSFWKLENSSLSIIFKDIIILNGASGFVFF